MLGKLKEVSFTRSDVLTSRVAWMMPTQRPNTVTAYGANVGPSDTAREEKVYPRSSGWSRSTTECTSSKGMKSGLSFGISSHLAPRGPMIIPTYSCVRVRTATNIEICHTSDRLSPRYSAKVLMASYRLAIFFRCRVS